MTENEKAIVLAEIDDAIEDLMELAKRLHKLAAAIDDDTLED